MGRELQVVIVAGLIVGHVVAACTGDVAAPSPQPPRVASISVDPGVQSLPAGTTAQFSATPRDAQGNALADRAVAWSSSSESVASVSATGMVTGVSAGVAQIRGTSDGTTGAATVTVTPRRILVDASRDGGVWWSPQSGDFRPQAWHQGKALADSLRSKGFVVDELARGAIVSPAALAGYGAVIRAGFYGSAYSEAELEAYATFLRGPVTLWLLSDHSATGDNLAVSLGVTMSGATSGTITSFAPHRITDGVASLDYVAGSGLAGPVPANVSILGRLNGLDVMGVVSHPTAKIFFLGDVNGIESVPARLIANLVAWGF